MYVSCGSCGYQTSRIRGFCKICEIVLPPVPLAELNPVFCRTVAPESGGSGVLHSIAFPRPPSSTPPHLRGLRVPTLYNQECCGDIISRILQVGAVCCNGLHIQDRLTDTTYPDVSIGRNNMASKESHKLYTEFGGVYKAEDYGQQELDEAVTTSIDRLYLTVDRLLQDGWLWVCHKRRWSYFGEFLRIHHFLQHFC